MRRCFDCHHLRRCENWGHKCALGNFQVVIYYGEFDVPITYARLGDCPFESKEEEKK